MTNKEKVEHLLKIFSDKDGNIDLSYIDFGNRFVFNNNQKADGIYNSYQQANVIYNNNQKANEIYNNSQEANEIYNHWQRAYEIDNNNQEIKIKIKYEDMSKEELIKEIKKLKGEIEK